MHGTTIALVLLALFTSNDKAAEIEGDLLEQSRTRGKLWFWWQVKLTCIALFFHGLRRHTGMLLLISYAMYWLTLEFNAFVLSKVHTFLWRRLDLNNAQLPIMENAIWSATAFGLGMLAVKLSPKHGGQVTLLAGGLLCGRVWLWDSPEMQVPRLVVFVLLPAILGVLLMKWMELRGAFHASQRNSRSGTL